MTRKINICIGDDAQPLGLLHYDQQGARESAAFTYDTCWTCNGFVPVTYLITPPWPRMRAG
jgi:hypothetical protein